MNLKRGWSVLVLVSLVFTIFFVFAVGCTATNFSDVQPTATVPVPTVAVEPTATPTVTVEPTKKPEPTVTNTPESTPTPTRAFTAIPTRSSRVWTIKELSTYLVEVGNWFLSPWAVPLLPREGDVVEVLEKFVFNETTTFYEGPIELVDPDAICNWTYQKLDEGYALGVKTPTYSEERTRAERWSQFSYTLGNLGVEPYCPQFNKNLANPFVRVSSSK